MLTESAGVWGPRVEATLPASRTNIQGSQLFSVSCPSPGNCVAVGEDSFDSPDYTSQDLLLTETGGVWARGIEAQLPPNATPTTEMSELSVTCPSPGNCSAVGSYPTQTAGWQGLLLGGTVTKPSPCIVPILKGKTFAAAKRSLTTHFCSAGRIKHAFSATVEKSRVISSKPKPGARRKHKAKVALVLSKGKRP